MLFIVLLHLDDVIIRFINHSVDAVHVPLLAFLVLTGADHHFIIEFLSSEMTLVDLFTTLNRKQLKIVLHGLQWPEATTDPILE